MIKILTKLFLKRCRAYDNNGEEFDIEMVFNNLKTTRYVSDGNSDTIIIRESDLKNLNSSSDKKVITY